MKAQVLLRNGQIDGRPLQFVDLPPPEPRPDEVQLRVTACGVCRTDLHVVEGDLPVRRSPLIPGHQIVGTVTAVGAEIDAGWVGRRAGIAWLHGTCGSCRHCTAGHENLCESARFTGWTDDGGYAEFAVAPAAFVHELPDGFDHLQAAPLLCAGIIGFRALRLTGVYEERSAGKRLGIYGFGAAGHVAIQLARARGLEVHVMTRDRDRHQALATELGAAWVGDAFAEPPAPLDAAIVFAPAGELLPAGLRALDRGGCLVLGGIHMSPIPAFDYSLLYGERVVRSVTNNTRDDARAFLAEAARIPVRTHVRRFALADANDALIALKHDAIRGAAVLTP